MWQIKGRTNIKILVSCWATTNQLQSTTKLLTSFSVSLEHAKSSHGRWMGSDRSHQDGKQIWNLSCQVDPTHGNIIHPFSVANSYFFWVKRILYFIFFSAWFMLGRTMYSVVSHIDKNNEINDWTQPQKQNWLVSCLHGVSKTASHWVYLRKWELAKRLHCYWNNHNSYYCLSNLHIFLTLINYT